MNTLERYSKEKAFISKSNNFILSHKRMSIAQRNVLNAILTKVEAKKDIDYVEFTLKEIAELIGITVTNYDQFRQVFSVMKDIEVSGADHEGISLGSLIGETKFLFNGMGIQFKFTDLGKKNFVNLGPGFTMQRFQSSIFQSIYAHEIWDLISMIKNQKNQEYRISLEDLRKRMFVEDKYPRFCDFKRRCLDTSVRMINESTGITVEYSTTRVGKAVSEIIFKIININPEEIYRKGGQRFIEFPETISAPVRGPSMEIQINCEDDVSRMAEILISEFSFLKDVAEGISRVVPKQEFYSILLTIRNKRGTFGEIKNTTKVFEDLYYKHRTKKAGY